MTDTIAPEVAAFAAEVRAALADLPRDEVDELTDGLEADLAERLDDARDADLGDPREYAAELRAAAGYPAGAPRRRFTPGATLLRELRELRDAWAAFVDRHRVLRGTTAMLASLRPAWWVFRGWLLYLLVCTVLLGGPMIPTDLVTWSVLVASVVVSVQIGRAVWLKHDGVRAALKVVDVVLLVISPFVVAALIGTTQAVASNEPWFPNQLMLGDRPIDNIFVYDEAGELVERAQLFDQDGRPLDLVQDESEYWVGSNGTIVVPADEPGYPRWNVYPLEVATDADLAHDGDVDRTTAPRPPFQNAGPLSGVTVEGEPATPAG